MEDIFEVLDEKAIVIAPCNHNHALVQNPFAWEEDAAEGEEIETSEAGEEA